MIVGMGMDLVDIARIRATLERHGERARARLFTAGELAYADRRQDPARHLAARFAAKEAAFKALSGSPSARAIGWRDIEVVSDLDGRPGLRLHGLAAARARELDVVAAWLTITHADQMAAATVVLESSGSRSGPGTASA